jgi:hypothetical protein
MTVLTCTCSRDLRAELSTLVCLAGGATMFIRPKWYHTSLILLLNLSLNLYGDKIVSFYYGIYLLKHKFKKLRLMSVKLWTSHHLFNLCVKDRQDSLQWNWYVIILWHFANSLLPCLHFVCSCRFPILLLMDPTINLPLACPCRSYPL